MNNDESILRAYIKEKNAAGEIVTYSTLVRDNILKRSNPTVFKVMSEMLDDKTLRGEYIKNSSGHMRLALFVNEGDEDHVLYLIKNLINEVVSLRLTMEGVMSSEIRRNKSSNLYHSLNDFDRK